MITDLKLEEYPGAIAKAQKNALKMKKDMAEIERARESREALLKSTDYKGLGSNKEERDAKFSMLLLADETYRTLSDDYDMLDWKVREAEIDIAALEREYSVAHLRYRSVVIQSEIFGGLPIMDARSPML